MPADGLEWQRREDLLTFEETERFARVMVERFGIDGIRLTGGEPTVRANISELVRMLASLDVDLSMTTNGVSLPLLAEDLRAGGLSRLNISCDSLRPERFAEITRRDDLARVLRGIDAAIDAGFDPVKVNCVVMRGVNDDEIGDFVLFGREKGVEVRFIEFMPLDADGNWSNSTVVPVQEILAKVNEVHPVEPVVRSSAPASRYRFTDGRGSVGIVASVTESFCSTCDRVRITADGQFRNCLFATSETDVRKLMRDGASDDDLAHAIEESVASKWAGHQINQVHFIRPRRTMSQIGG